MKISLMARANIIMASRLRSIMNACEASGSADGHEKVIMSAGEDISALLLSPSSVETSNVLAELKKGLAYTGAAHKDEASIKNVCVVLADLVEKIEENMNDKEKALTAGAELTILADAGLTSFDVEILTEDREMTPYGTFKSEDEALDAVSLLQELNEDLWFDEDGYGMYIEEMDRHCTKSTSDFEVGEMSDEERASAVQKLGGHSASYNLN